MRTTRYRRFSHGWGCYPKLGGGNIIDMHNVSTDFLAAPVNATESATQKLRIFYQFWDDTPKNPDVKAYNLGTITYTYTKVDNRQWKLVASQ